MTVLVIVVSVAVPLCFVVIILGCLDCLFKKKRFENVTSRQSHLAQHNAAYSADLSDSSPSSEQVTIEPLPDILSKVAAATPLRPKITCTERGKQEATLSLVSVQRSFPRENVTYVNELGSGWFGKALESEASRIVAGSATSHVVVKMLKDDATKAEQKQFLDEVSAFKCLEHPNLMSVLGQCTETNPYLVILEYAANDNLKAFLLHNQPDTEVLIKKNRLVSFAVDAAAGLACLHRHDYIHNDANKAEGKNFDIKVTSIGDLAARNCLVMADYTLRIGDYGISDTIYKDEYYNTGRELLPVRWMAPETLLQSDGVWTSQPGDKVSDIWSFGVLLWEIFSVGDRPYSMLTDEAVLQGVVVDRVVLPSEIDTKLPYKDKVWSLLSQCWQDPAQRLDVEAIHQHLQELNWQRADTMDTVSDFEQKWSQLAPKGQDRTSSTDTDLGSRIALAGSFITDKSSSPSDAPSPLEGDTTSDVVLDMDEADMITIQPHADTAAVKPSISTVKGNDIKISSSQAVDPELSLPQPSYPASALPAQITVETEVTKTPASPVPVTPSKPSSNQVIATSTPVFQGDQSASQIHSPAVTASPGSAYLTANETLLNEIDQSMPPSSLGTDFSLDSELTFHELTDTTLYESGLQNQNDNQAKGNDVLKPEQSLSDDDFSEFVRTSPTAPTTDFTDFESAVIAIKLSPSAEIANANSLTEGSDKVNQSPASGENVSQHSSGSDFEFVSSNVDESMPRGDAAEVFTPKASTIAELNTNSSISGPEIDDTPKSSSSENAEGQGVLDENPASSSQDSEAQSSASPVLPNAEDMTDMSDKIMDSKQEPVKLQTIEDLATEVSPSSPEPVTENTYGDTPDIISLGSGPDVISLDSYQDITSVDSAAKVEAMEQVPSAITEESATTPSLQSNPSLFADDIFNTEAAPSMQPNAMMAFTDLQDPPSLVPSLTPIAAAAAPISEALEEHKADLLAALDDSSNFSTLDFGDPHLSSGPGQMEAGGSAHPEKVGTPSKSQSASAECDINNHSLKKNSADQVTDSSSAMDTYNGTSDPFHHNDNYSSGQSDIMSLESEDFRQSNLRSSLYRCSNIRLDHVEKSGLNIDSIDSSFNKEDLQTDLFSPALSDSDSSSTSGSEREYFCEGSSDTGQPPPSPTDSSWHQPDIHSSPAEIESSSPADFDEHALRIASEIYLSRGLTSPRVFEIPPLETIPEHTSMPSIQEEANHTPSDTSSLEVRYDDLFGNDAYEWDDFFGDPLIGREMNSGQQQSQNQLQQSSFRDLEVSDWSLELETDNGPSSASLSRLSSESPTNTSTQSEHIYPQLEDLPTNSGKTVHYLSDSELVTPPYRQSFSSSKQTLVSSLLSQMPSATAVMAPDRSDFYSLVEHGDLETDTSLLGEVSSSSAAKITTTESLSLNSTITSSCPSFPASSPLTPPSPASQITDLPNDFDFAVSTEPSMSSGVLSSSQEPDIPLEKSGAAVDIGGDLLGLGFDGGALSSNDPGPVDSQEKSQTDQSAAVSDPFANLLDDNQSPSNQETPSKSQQESTPSQTNGNSLIDF